jgi:hypothetical protein
MTAHEDEIRRLEQLLAIAREEERGGIILPKAVLLGTQGHIAEARIEIKRALGAAPRI